MVFDISIAMTWVLFLALFPIAFFWLRRAWRIIGRRDFSEVALKRGALPANPEKFAPFSAVLNLVAGIVALAVILGVLFFGLEYDRWTAIAGSTIWLKFICDFIIARHAHPARFDGRLAGRG